MATRAATSLVLRSIVSPALGLSIGALAAAGASVGCSAPGDTTTSSTKVSASTKSSEAAPSSSAATTAAVTASAADTATASGSGAASASASASEVASVSAKPSYPRPIGTSVALPQPPRTGPPQLPEMPGTHMEVPRPGKAAAPGFSASGGAAVATTMDRPTRPARRATDRGSLRLAPRASRLIGAATRQRLGAALATFTHETQLGAEHRRLMDEHHRPVEWERSGAAALSPALRQLLADLWRGRMVAEHRSVGIFSLYALDLLGAGAPAEALSLACRAALDEVRHAELFARLAELYSGAKETPPPGIPPMPDDPDVPMCEQVAREALFLCVCSETYSAATLAELHARAGDPAVRGALGVVLADEIYHARMGWALLGSMLAQPGAEAIKARVQGELTAIFDSLAKDLFGSGALRPEPPIADGDRVEAEAHGYMTLADEYDIFRATIDDVWIPGLAGLGLDPAALRGRFPESRS